jgi:membrane-associated phospholipid phosphatase
MRQVAGPLDPSPMDRREAALARRWRGLPAGIPSLLYLLAWGAVLVVVGVAVGLLMAKVVDHDAIGRADAGVDRFLAAHRTSGWNSVTHYITDTAETLTIATLAVLTVAGAALVWRRWREPALVAAAVLGEVLLFLIITMLVDRPRPPVGHLDAAPPTSSFPSGHTAAAVALYGSWALVAWQRARSTLLRAGLTLLAIVLPIAVGLARMYRGMHYPSDVLAGAALSATWLALSARAVRLGVIHRGQRARADRVARRRPLLRHG